MEEVLSTSTTIRVASAMVRKGGVNDGVGRRVCVCVFAYVPWPNNNHKQKGFRCRRSHRHWCRFEQKHGMRGLREDHRIYFVKYNDDVERGRRRRRRIS